MIGGACSVNKNWNNDNTKAVVCQCILLSPAGLSAASGATLEMTGGKKKVSCQLGCREREKKGNEVGVAHVDKKEKKKIGGMG